MFFNRSIAVILFALLFQTSFAATSVTSRADSLSQAIDKLNDDGEYEQSVKLLNGYLHEARTPEEVYFGHLYLAETYKRLFDYPKVFVHLRGAGQAASRIRKNRQFYLDNVKLQETLAYFDTQQYQKSLELMQDIERTNYRNLSLQDKAYMIMQRGYIAFLNENYDKADRAYNEALRWMQQASPCDLPVIYGKKVSLYGKLGDEQRMLKAYELGVKLANGCRITKYNLYMAEVMRNAYREMDRFDKAFYYFGIYDSLNSIYNADAYKMQLQELEVEYETVKKERAIDKQRATISSSNKVIGLLAAAVIIILLIVLLAYVVRRRHNAVKERQRTLQFTRQLFKKTEEERKRIAGDLHDSVNNELLLIRAMADEDLSLVSRVDELMESVRGMSRNLHPIMFEELGLKDSIEQLAERTQEQHAFPIQTDIEYAGELDTNDALQLYRIVQESVNNMLKYSEAVAGIIRLFRKDQKLVLQVQDNGKGFNVAQALESVQSFGLQNLIQRAQAISGTAVIHSDSTGTLITVEVPLKHSNKS